MAVEKSLDKNELCRPERSEGPIQQLRDSSVATNTLPQSDTNRTLQQPCEARWI